MAYNPILNQGARNRLTGYCPTETSVVFGFIDTKRITRSTGSFIPVWSVGMCLTVSGSATNNFTFTITGIAADGSYLTVAETVATAAASPSVTLTCAQKGMGYLQLVQNGVIGIWSGDLVTAPDAAESGSLLALITLAGGAFVPGAVANGLVWEMATVGAINKPTAANWSGVGIAAGEAKSAYIYDSNYRTGAAAVGARVGLSVGVGYGALQLSTTTIAVGGPIAVQSATITVPTGA